MQSPPSRRVPLQLRERQRCILYSDATGSGMMAWVLHAPFAKVWAATDVPNSARAWAHWRKKQIGTWELMAAICALKWLLSIGQADLEIVCFVDNKSALGALVRGCSRKSDWNCLIGNLWLLVAEKAHFLHLWYVPSHLNLADAPTRPSEKAEQLAELQARDFQCVEWLFPPDAPWGR